MQSLPQHACDGCNELLDDIERMLSRVAAAKRLGTLEEMQNELCALQLNLGGLRTKGRELKAFVTRAVAQACVREYADEIAPRRVEMWPEHCDARAGTVSTDNGGRVWTENGKANH